MKDNSIVVSYEKRKNTDLFKTLERKDGLFLSNIQNYSPIYNRFFILNETNYKAVNLNHISYISDVKTSNEENSNIYECIIKNGKTNKTLHKDVFFKLAPLLDPYKYLIGKYNHNDPSLFALPNYNSCTGDVHPKILDSNNSSYVDGLFSFLSSMLIHNYNFTHGVDYYGSFLAIKNDFKFNVIDDIDYLCKSEFFNKHKNTTLFKIEDYEYLIENDDENDNERKIKPLIKIKNQDNESIKSSLSIKSINDNLYEDLFEEDIVQTPDIDIISEKDQKIFTLNDLKESSLELLDITNNLKIDGENITTTIKSNSTCSSRTSHTSENDDLNNHEDDADKDQDGCDKINKDNDEDDDEDDDKDDDDEDDDDDDEDDEDEDEDEECIYSTIPKFPVQVICMENCETTFDDLIMNEDLSHDEWFSALMQIVMILISYQKAFSFTHNDLHTNNIMYKTTNKKFIYYCYKNKYYKVPTFGRIFKIIDFGRSVYKYDGKIFCSDSFQNGGDAATQYNTEPYFNEKKPRLEPNYSFDLCRLACSIFDYLVEEMDEIKNISECDPIVRVIVEWCIDDNGVNILYKNNGSERYPDFKLYKMIARYVHNHTPQAQLERPEFSSFLIEKLPDDINSIINIDIIPSLSNSLSK
jgi:hypothetical protein